MDIVKQLTFCRLCEPGTTEEENKKRGEQVAFHCPKNGGNKLINAIQATRSRIKAFYIEIAPGEVI